MFILHDDITSIKDQLASPGFVPGPGNSCVIHDDNDDEILRKLRPHLPAALVSLLPLCTPHSYM